MNKRTYTLTISAEQAAAISTACEVLARIGMCQLDVLAPYLGTSRTDTYHEIRDRLEEAERSLKPLTGHDHPSAYWGIRSDHVRIDCKRAWDIHAVVRRQLALDRCEDTGEAPSRISVVFDAPDNVARERLATIAAKPEGQIPNPVFP